MGQVLILVEGQTEETFIRNILAPHLGTRNIFVYAPLATTSRVKHGPVFKGGITSYAKFKKEIDLLLKSNTQAQMITTMIDFYGLPNDFPGRASMPSGDAYTRCIYVEQQIQADINNHRFRAYLSLHEFEALLFVDPKSISGVFPGSRVMNNLYQIRAEFSSPEEINDHPNTAPSKRLKQLLPDYNKPLHGSLITGRIGLSRIRAECRHFNDWVTMLENLP